MRISWVHVSPRFFGPQQVEMSLILPDWVEHHSDADDKKKRQTIFSIHVHPDGSRLATGGLDQKIRIWATDPILREDIEKREDTHKLLCTMSRHTGSVLVVRWSPSGRYLASGSDDTICLIWDLDPTGLGGASFGSSGNEVSIEAWRPHRRLAGHESDIVDLAWSPDEQDSYIATVGLDSRVMVWSGYRQGSGSFERMRVIDGHQGFVKGVVWDPIGQFLATASDDKTVKIWRVGGDWGLEKTVSKPFEASPSSTFFRRLSWSPDGAHLLCANAMSGPVFVASVIKREDWSSDIYLVGHENSVVVTAFSPCLFYDRDGEKSKATVLALGSIDQSVSIWITGQSRPILVARDVFQRQVMDLSWSSDGMTLYACSADGHIAAFAFDTENLLRAASSDDLNAAREMYNFTEKRRKFELSKTVRYHGNGLSSSLQGTSDRPNMLIPRKAGVPRAPTSVLPPSAVSGSKRLDQQITLTKEGKRRIRPTLLDGNADSSYEYTLSSAVDSRNAASGYTHGLDTSDSEVIHPVHGTKRRASLSLYDGPDFGGVSGKKIKDIGRTLGGDLPKELSAPLSTLQRSSSNTVSTSSLPGSAVHLPTPPIISTYKCEGLGLRIEARNFDLHRPCEIYCFDTQVSKTIWMDFHPACAILATISDDFSAIAFEDEILAIYSSKGRRETSLKLDNPCARLESCGHYLIAITIDGCLHRWSTYSNGPLGQSISIAPLFAKSPGRLSNDEIVHFWVHTNGLPVLIMRSEKAYILDTAKMAWVLASSGWFADCSPSWEGRTRGRGASMDSISGGGLQQTRRDPIRAIESEINDLVVIQRSTSGIQASPRPPSDRMNEFQVAIMLKHLEVRLTASELLQSSNEYKTNLLGYARKLTEEGIRNQAEDLCKSLLGPIYFNPQQKHNWQPTVCGLSKRALLGDVLKTMSKGNLLLGLHQTYQELLRNVSAESW